MVVVARAGVPFDLKSTAISGLALVLRTTDLASLAAAMAERFGPSPGVFGHDPVVIDLSGLGDATPESVDFAGLLDLLAGHRLRPVGVRGGSEALLRRALEAGLSDVADDPSGGAPLPRQPLPVQPMASAETLDAAAAAAAAAAAVVVAAAPAVEPAAPVAAGLPSPTLIVDRPLRSGQQVYAKGGDLVVLATVNVGAEVIADGSIHVYGPLRGKAVAGAKGNVDARIFSTCMEPQLLAIAGTYRTTENPLPADVVGRPAQIRLEGERLVFEPLA